MLCIVMCLQKQIDLIVGLRNKNHAIIRGHTLSRCLWYIVLRKHNGLPLSGVKDSGGEGLVWRADYREVPRLSCHSEQVYIQL